VGLGLLTQGQQDARLTAPAPSTSRILLGFWRCGSRDTRDDRDVRDIHAQAEKVPADPTVPQVASVPLPPILGHTSGMDPGLKFNNLIFGGLSKRLSKQVTMRTSMKLSMSVSLAGVYPLGGGTRSVASGHDEAWPSKSRHSVSPSFQHSS